MPWWRRKTGREVALDWRRPGGVTDIVRYLDAQYSNAFRSYWVNTLHRNWSDAVENGFTNPRVAPGSAAAASRQAFLSSDVEVDVFFFGGGFEFSQQAARRLIAIAGLHRAAAWRAAHRGCPVFIDFVVSLEGQKLWDFRAGTPGGPQRYTLRHAPIRRDLYAPQWQQYVADPDMRPYDDVRALAE